MVLIQLHHSNLMKACMYRLLSPNALQVQQPIWILYDELFILHIPRRQMPELYEADDASVIRLNFGSDGQELQEDMLVCS